MEGELVCAGHRTRVKAGNLVLGAVRVDEKGSCKAVVADHQQGGVHTLFAEPVAVFACIQPGAGHQARAFVQQCERVGDVGRTPAVHATHVVDKETQADALELVGQDMLGKVARQSSQETT
jgi:hypothetical protein